MKKVINKLKINLSRKNIETFEDSLCLSKFCLIDVQNRTLQAERLELQKDKNNCLIGTLFFYHPKYLEEIKLNIYTNFTLNTFSSKLFAQIEEKIYTGTESDKENFIDYNEQYEEQNFIFTFNENNHNIWIPKNLDSEKEYFIEFIDYAQIPNFIKGFGICPVAYEREENYFSPYIKLQALNLDNEVLAEKEFNFNSKEEILNYKSNTEHTHIDKELPCCILDFRRNSKIQTFLLKNKDKEYRTLDINDDNSLTSQEDVIEEKEEYFDAPISITHRQWHTFRDWLIELKNTNKNQDLLIIELQNKIEELENKIKNS